MSEQKKGQKNLESFIEKVGINNDFHESSKSNTVGSIGKRNWKTQKTKFGNVKVLQLQVEPYPPFIVGPTQDNTDAAVADEEYRGKNVLYNLFFLTSYADAAGAGGPFYIQLVGDQATTDIKTIYPNVKNGQWCRALFSDMYVGKLSEIRIAAGTDNGWCPVHIFVFYPRGYVWVYNNTWVQTDGYPTITIDVP